MNNDTQQQIRSIINRVSEVIPHHGLGKLGDKIAFESIRRLETYQFQLKSVYERREVVELERPCLSLAEGSPAPIPRNQFNPWDLTIEVPDDLSLVSDHRAEATATVHECQDCSASGRFSCDTCKASGIQTCGECQGNGWTACKGCNGIARFVRGDGHEHPCEKCDLDLWKLQAEAKGEEYVRHRFGCGSLDTGWGGAHICETCSGQRQHKCISCNGHCYFTCARCEGKKNLTRFLAAQQSLHVVISSERTSDPQCPKRVSKQVQSSHFAVVCDIRESAILVKSEVIKMPEFGSIPTDYDAPMKGSKLIPSEAPKRHNHLHPLVEQRLSISQPQVYEFHYSFQGKSYSGWCLPNTMISSANPITDKMEAIVQAAKITWDKDSSSHSAVEDIHKCIVMARINPDCAEAMRRLAKQVPKTLFDRSQSLESILGKAQFVLSKLKRRFWDKKN